MKLLKYVIVARDGKEHAIVLPMELEHKSVVPKGYTPMSAGFFTNVGTTIHTSQFGSDTLRIGPRLQDAEILRKELGL